MRAFSSLLLATAAHAGPCDIFAAAGTPCVAAHAISRALYDSYAGRLYQVQRGDGATLDIAAAAAGGAADAAAQDRFCAGASCVIQRIYDQSPSANHLDTAPAGGHVHTPDKPTNATRLPTLLGGKKVYGAFFEGGMGYRKDNTTGIARGNEAETLYMVTVSPGRPLEAIIFSFFFPLSHLAARRPAERHALQRGLLL